MEKKRAYAGALLLILVVITILHSIAYGILASNPENAILKNTPVSGLIIQTTPEGSSTSLFSFSGILLLLEWTVAIVGSVFFMLKQKVDLQREIINLYLTKKKYNSDKTQTDIDVLYEILKEKKHLNLASISKVFHIPKNTALEWARILESGKLVSIKYPQVGEPEVTFTQ